MIAYEATYEVNGSNPETVLVGAPNLAAAAKKAKTAETPKKELVKLEKTDKLIL